MSVALAGIRFCEQQNGLVARLREEELVQVQDKIKESCTQKLRQVHDAFQTVRLISCPSLDRAVAAD